MIVAVKRKDSKKLIIKIVSILAVIVMFWMYYTHMSEEFSKQEMDLKKGQKENTLSQQKLNKSRKIEKLIFREVETAIDLIGQEYVQKVKVINRKILIVCDNEANLDALMVRYGTMALIKNELQNTKIAIDLKFVIESKFDESKNYSKR